MPSKTSFFNRTLFRKNLSRYWPLWGFASFAGSVFPLALLLGLINGRNPFSNEAGMVAPLDATQTYYSVLTFAVPIISLIYAILCAMAVWNYLYNARSVGLMHTLPIRRESLFTTSLLSGMAMMLIPYAITGALSILVISAYGGFEIVGILVTIGGVIGDSLFFFALATLVAQVVGNIFALPALYMLLNFLAVLLDWLLSIFAQGFLFGVNSEYSGVVEFLSPVVYLMRKVCVNMQTEEILVAGQEWPDYRTVAVTLENGWLIAAYAAVGLLLLLTALLLYRRRASETAGDVVAVKVVRPVFRFGLAGLSALMGGQLLYALLWASFSGGSEYFDLIPLAVCMMIAGAIGYYAASMLLAKSVKVFRGSIPGLAVLLVACAAICAVLYFDVLGIQSRVPAMDEIESVELEVADNSYHLYAGEDDLLLEQVRAVHGALAADADYYRDWRNRSTVHWDDETGYAYVCVTYHLRSGLSVERSYSIYLTRERVEQSGTADNLLDGLVNSEAMKYERLRYNDSRLTASSGYLYVEASDTGFDFNSREAQTVLDAVARDTAAGIWGDYDWFNQNDDADALAMDLELHFTRTDDPDRDRYYDSIVIRVRPAMTETIACLQEMGFLTGSDLRTYRELYPNRYGDYGGYNGGYTFYDDTDGVSAALEPADAAAASADVIGGADGLTAIVVS